MQELKKISIPESLSFSDLKLNRDNRGAVSFDISVIQSICDASNTDIKLFMEYDEGNIAGLIVGWYQEHIASGGKPDAIAEDLILEAKLEDKHGGGFSLPVGRA